MTRAIDLPAPLWRTLSDIMSVPVAPFAETWLLDAIVARLRRYTRIRQCRDAYGNLLLQYRPKGRRGARLCFQAHLDHPGFRFVRSLSAQRGEAEVWGQIPLRCRKAHVRFFQTPTDRGVRAFITAVEAEGPRAVRVGLRLDGPVAEGALGMWDQPPLRRRGRRVQSRGHDDTLGTALLVHLLQEAARRRFPEPFDVLLTRAEEAGLVGTCALLAGQSFKLPPCIITIEMPRSRGEVKAGDGVVCRVGDGACAYDQRLLAHLDAVAQSCARADPAFRWQRRLAWAGRTEASQFAFHGFHSAALCLATENGHNIGPDGRPAPEIVHTQDLHSLATLLRAVARLPIRLDHTWRQYRQHYQKRARPLFNRLLS